jgi:MarR family transcriptional regulator, organic hydroperoxide resistance regulator
MPKKVSEDLLPDDKQHTLWLLLSQTRSAIFRARQERVGHYLHPNQALALATIWGQNGQATPAIISRALFLERHTVSELISRMEEKGLVTKSRDPKRKNVVRVAITEKGREVGRQYIQRDFIAGIIGNLTNEQQEQMRQSLTILMDATQKILGTSAEPLQGPGKKTKTK